MEKYTFKFQKTSRIIAIILLCVTVLSSTCITAFAEENNAINKPETNIATVLTTVGKVIDGGQVIIDGKENNLYREFANKNEAITDIKEKVPTLLSVLSTEYNLAPLTDENWKEYKDAMFMLFDSENKPENYDESNIEFRTLRAFFDIYENSEKNEQILEKVQVLKYVQFNRSLNKEIDEELALLLPYTEPYARAFIETKKNDIVPYAGAAYDVTKAVNYANKYATNPNKPTYYYFSRGDCANFASQILENAGVSQIVYNDVGKGWWHKRETGFLGIGYKHTHSQSWSMADTFARYQGIMYSTTNHNSFKANISKGSFIVADFDNDGDWDHCGFVTDKSSSDYKVAQHTSNYNEWASSSKNGWDNIGGDGGKYARVRK